MTGEQRPSCERVQRTLINEIRGRIGTLEKLKADIQRIAGKRAETPSGEDFQALEKQRSVETKQLNDVIRRLADLLIAEAYRTAAREDNYTLFFDTAPLFTQLTDDIRKQADALKSISRVSISNPDAVKEINRLLDHTSVKRIAEEMDVANYNAQAIRLFDRIGAEFKDEQDMLKSASAEQEETEPSLVAYVTATNENIQSLRGLVDPIWKDVSLLSAPLPDDLRDQILTADKFFAQYCRFLKYCDTTAELMKSDFGSEGSTEAYLCVTEPHARRIEKEGLFASPKTIGMGVAAGLCVAFILLFLDNNLALKNWALQLALMAAVVMYIASILFGKLAREAHMRSLRNTLDRHISRIFSAGPAPPTKERPDSSFKFPKLSWSLFQEETRVDDRLPRSGALAEELETMSNRPWVAHEIRMWIGNAAVLALIVSLPLLISDVAGTLDLGRTRTFEFLSSGNGHGSCLLETGRVLLADGDSYFVMSNNGSVVELSKSSVSMIKPGDKGSAAPDCANSRPTADPMPISLARPLEESQSLGAAADKLSEGIQSGMKLIADKISPEGGGCGNECPPPQSTSSQTIIMPVLVEARQSAVMPDIVQEGPIFTTQIYGADGIVHDIGGRNVVILPLFTDPVTGKMERQYGADGVDKPAEAFHFGLNHMNDPALPGTRDTLVQRIGAAFKRCVAATRTAYEKAKSPQAVPKLTLSIRGFASEEWTGPIARGTSKPELNWYLAEGRRLAVIEALGVRGNDLIEIKADRPDMNLDALTAISRKTTTPQEIAGMGRSVEAGFQFAEYEMPVALSTWLKQTIGDGAPEQGEMRILARSVVITIEGDALANCGTVWRPSAQESVAN